MFILGFFCFVLFLVGYLFIYVFSFSPFSFSLLFRCAINVNFHLHIHVFYHVHCVAVNLTIIVSDENCGGVENITELYTAQSSSQ